MKRKPAYLKHMLGLAALLLLAPAGIFAQEGYYGATESIALGPEHPIPVLAARSEPYTGGGEGYFGAQQPSDTCAQARQVTVRKNNHLMLVRGTTIGSATPPLADQDAEISTCAVPRSHSVWAVPDPSASQNQVEYGGGGM
jgi:hypothetical protein